MCDGSTNIRDCPVDVGPEAICCFDADCGLGKVCGQPGARGVCAGVAATPFGNAEILDDGSVRLIADTDAATQ